MNTTVKSFHEVESNAEAIELGHRRLPVLGWIRAGELIGHPIRFGDEDWRDYIMVAADVPSSAFGLRIVGDSMLTRFTEGDVIVVNPDIAPRPSDFVVASTEHGCEAVFKKYRLTATNADGSEAFQLVSLNPDYPTLDSTTQALRVIGVMIEHRIPRRH